MRLVAYIRVSRVAGREGPSFISPAEQRKAIEGAGHGVVEWVEDLDQPGSHAERPGLIRAMDLVESGAAEGIVVAKLDRFGRSVVDLGQLVARLRDANAALISVSEGVDTSTSTGRLITTILVSIGEWELDRIASQWAGARSAAAERGVYLAEAPVGYTKAPEGHLVVDPAIAAAIGEAFRRRAADESWSRIAKWLDSEGIRSKRGGNWTVSALRRAIANRAYLGESNGVIAHEPVVSTAVFEAANLTKGVVPARSGRASGLLSGILRCAGCRYAMKMSMSRTRHGKAFTEYRCKAARGENAGGRCEAPASVKSNVIESFVMEAFWIWYGEQRATGVDPDQLTEEAEGAVLRARAERDAVLDRELAAILGGDQAPAYLDLVRRRQQTVEAAEAELGRVARRANAAALGDVDLRDIWSDISLQDQRKYLSSVFECAFVRRGGQVPIGERALLCLHGEAPELPTRGRRWIPRPFDFPAAAEALGE